MNNEQLLRRIKKLAKQDAKNRLDPRYVKTMALLTSKGFLFSNRGFPRLPNIRLDVADAIWAGRNVEPRILEVLPAAIVRLGKHFYFDTYAQEELVKTLADLKQHKTEGYAFAGVPYAKLKIWADFRLKDNRVKTVSEKKIVKTYRLKPQSIKKLERLGAIQEK